MNTEGMILDFCKSRWMQPITTDPGSGLEVALFTVEFPLPNNELFCNNFSHNKYIGDQGETMKSKRSISSLIAATVLLSLASVLAQAQSRYNDTPKFEIGGQFVVTRLSDILDDTNVGVGGRLTYNFTQNIALEGELNYFPQDLGVVTSTSSYQGLFGIKTGIRSERAGIFGKIRPGFTRFDRPTPATTATQFTLDLGGVLELYPSKSTVVRFDIGDAMINYTTDLVPAALTGTSHNLQFGIGFGFRF
jgi:outer membrane protein with beta-barrel domain